MRNYYADPTANTAIANVDRVLRRERKRQEEEKRREETRRRGPGKALELWDKTKGKPPVSSEFGKRISG